MILLRKEGSDVGSLEKEGKKCSLGSFRPKFRSQDPTLYQYLTKLPKLLVQYANYFFLYCKIVRIVNHICPKKSMENSRLGSSLAVFRSQDSRLYNICQIDLHILQKCKGLICK